MVPPNQMKDSYWVFFLGWALCWALDCMWSQLMSKWVLDPFYRWINSPRVVKRFLKANYCMWKSWDLDLMAYLLHSKPCVLSVVYYSPTLLNVVIWCFQPTENTTHYENSSTLSSEKFQSFWAPCKIHYNVIIPLSICKMKKFK